MFSHDLHGHRHGLQSHDLHGQSWSSWPIMIFVSHDLHGQLSFSWSVMVYKVMINSQSWTIWLVVIYMVMMYNLHGIHDLYGQSWSTVIHELYGQSWSTWSWCMTYMVVMIYMVSCELHGHDVWPTWYSWYIWSVMIYMVMMYDLHSSHDLYVNHNLYGYNDDLYGLSWIA